MNVQVDRVASWRAGCLGGPPQRGNNASKCPLNVKGHEGGTAVWSGPAVSIEVLASGREKLSESAHHNALPTMQPPQEPCGRGGEYSLMGAEMPFLASGNAVVLAEGAMLQLSLLVAWKRKSVSELWPKCLSYAGGKQRRHAPSEGTAAGDRWHQGEGRRVKGDGGRFSPSLLLAPSASLRGRPPSLSAIARAFGPI